MKGGLVRTTTVKHILNPDISIPADVLNGQKKSIRSLIMAAYENLTTHYPDLPKKLPTTHQPKLTDALDKSIVELEKYYKASLRVNTPTNSTSTELLSGLSNKNPRIEMLSSDEFKTWIRYMLQGKVYKKLFPYYTDNEFNMFTRFAVSLNKLSLFITDINSSSPTTTTSSSSPTSSSPHPTTSSPLDEYEKYVTLPNVNDVTIVSELCSKIVGEKNVLFSMSCVIQLNRKPRQSWTWERLTGDEQKSISSNPYCAQEHRTHKRLMWSPGTNTYSEPLNKINVRGLNYVMNDLNDVDVKKLNERITTMLGGEKKKEAIIAQLKRHDSTEPTPPPFESIDILTGGGKYKYYEFKILHSRIWVQPRLTIPGIMCTLSGFDEDGICDFEFVYVCVIRPPQNNEPAIDMNYDDLKVLKDVKNRTYYELMAEKTRIERLLGGETLSAPSTAAGTLKQYYDTKELIFANGGSRTGFEGSPPQDLKPRLLQKNEPFNGPCTLILEYEPNEKDQYEPVWKVAEATTTQAMAFRQVAEQVSKEFKPGGPTLDNTMIRVFKVTNGLVGPNNITVFVEVKKVDETGQLVYVYYQALASERYEVYANSVVAGEHALINKHKYNWVQSTGL
jgi:hypothetical protein